MIDNLILFVAIVQAGSLSKAAKRCNVSTATLTRKLQKLEMELGCKLLQRSARGLKLTKEGEMYYERCKPLLSSLQQTVHEIRHEVTEPSGVVRMLAPINLAVTTLEDFWIELLDCFPKLQLDLHLDNRNNNLFEQGADLALRVGVQHNPNYVQRKLASVSMVILASPSYLAKTTPIHCPEDLFKQDWLLATPLTGFVLKHKDKSKEICIQQAKIKVNEIRLCIALAARGLGMCYVPLNLCRQQLEAGELVHVLPQWQAPTRDIYVVWQAQKQLPARVRVVVEALADFMKTKE